jgi:hypothetical protein
MDSVYIKVSDLNKWTGKYFDGKDIVSVEDILGVLEDVADECEHWKEKFEDLEEDLRENYKAIPIDYGMSDRDFI